MRFLIIYIYIYIYMYVLKKVINKTFIAILYLLLNDRNQVRIFYKSKESRKEKNH